MPATAAIDNETLDHLLSVVDEGNQYSGIGRDPKVEILRRLAAQWTFFHLPCRGPASEGHLFSANRAVVGFTLPESARLPRS